MIGDVAHPPGRDGGFAVGTLHAGAVADAYGILAAIAVVAALIRPLRPGGRVAHAGDSPPPSGDLTVRGRQTAELGSRARSSVRAPKLVLTP